MGEQVRGDPAAAAPLRGVRVVSVEQFGAGPFATLFLADMGAEVVKIEMPPMGDVGRSVPPGQAERDSLYFQSFNRGKRSLALDLKNAAGRAVFERLVASAQIVFNNLRGDQVGVLGLDYAHLKEINPTLVCASLSAYGRCGPRAGYPGYDAVVQAEAGWAALTGDPGGPPVKSGLSLADYMVGLASALGVIVALFDVQRGGPGRDVDIALYDVALATLSYPATWYLTAGIHTTRQPMSAHPSIVPFQFFQTADGYIAVACAKERFFRKLAGLIDRPELLADPRFAGFELRDRHRDELLATLSERFREETTEWWMARLEGCVPCASVRSMEDALDPDELTERGMLASYHHPVFGDVRSVGLPIKLAGFLPDYRAAPALDGDRWELLQGLGYSPEEVGRLEEAGAFGNGAR
jgi:crotonobetainyl-CoA:carnitine CoA-transferase CaiB-like acyl-CoA transferase